MKDKDLLRYSRHIMLPEIDIDGQKSISSSRIAVVGLGGLGCSASVYLTASGIGELNLIDNDFIDLTNLQRQILFSEVDLNKKKVEIAEKKLLSLNDSVKVSSKNIRLDNSNIDEILEGSELILDCTDNFETRKAINAYCLNEKKILISGSSQGWKGQFFTLDFRNENSPCYQCFFEDLNSEDLSCRESSIFSPLVGIIGSFMASELIKKVVSIGELKSEMIEIDLMQNKFNRLNLRKNKNCLLCSKVKK